MIIIEWILGIGIMFGLAMVMNFYISGNLKEFFVFLTFFNAFVVWGGLLPFWTLILNIIILCFIVYTEMSNKNM